MTLVGLDYSPWTEKARWALDHHQIPYRFSQYTPMLGAPLLRLRTGVLRGKVSVPVLLKSGGAVRDSFEIARFAEAHGTGAPLFPPGQDAEIARWNTLSEEALAAGRARVVPRVLADPQAQAESLPDAIPRAMRPLLRPMARVGARYLQRKYETAAAAEAAHLATQRRVLDALGRALKGREHILGTFSYADVAMAVVFAFISPVDDRFVSLGSAERSCFTDPHLAHAYAHLVAWRDRLYERHR